MIEELTVKNFALIKEANINFKKNLNVLSGETGSGKSILIGSIDLAMGKRANRDAMMTDDQNTEVCITFYEKNEDIIEKLKKIDVELVDDRVIIYRKVTKDKNISKINDISCTLNRIKEVTQILVDIYGQHDSEDLRKNSLHIEFLDDFIGKESKALKKNVETEYEKLKKLQEYFSTFDMDEDRKKREIELLTYEIKEIDEAKIKDGEEEALADKFKQLSNASKIIESLSEAKDILEESNIGKAVKELRDVEKYDDTVSSISEAISDVDSIVLDAVKDIDRKINDLDVDDKELNATEERLDLIRNILAKYKNNIDTMKKEYIAKKEKLELLSNYDMEKEKVEDEIKEAKKNLEKACQLLSEKRKEKAIDFKEKLIVELKELGFLDVNFDINIERSDEIKMDGYDDVTFMLSLNPGEKFRRLSDVASGG
ncbi:MAG: hypothetical protein MJ151_02425 [Lachnospiraceae bacterium]|nr:hypothetical protein [Lachnospiraceae bacterium]